MQAIQKVLQRFISGDNGVLGVLGVVFVILVGGQVCRGDSGNERAGTSSGRGQQRQ